MRRAFTAIPFIAVALVLALAGCGAATGPRPGAGAPPASAPAVTSAPAASERGLPTGRVRITRPGNGPVVLDLTVEVADTPVRRARGLMGVTSLPDDHGMAFLFPEGADGGFWMKDTLIPLDIAFWDGDGRVLEILQMQPCRVADHLCPTYDPGERYVGALEVNLGVLGRNGVQEGDVVTLVREPPAGR